MPDAHLVEVLDRTVNLLKEINESIETRSQALAEESSELDQLLGRVDFGTFDATLDDLNGRERDDG